MDLSLEDVRRIIVNARPELQQRIELDPVKKAKLRRVGVISPSLDDQLKVAAFGSMHKLDLLLDNISLGPVNKFLEFCKVLHEEGRSDLLDLMSVNIRNVERQLATCESQSQPTFCDPSAVDIPTFPYQRSYYKETLGKSPIYEYATRSPYVHVDDIFTNIQLTNNEDDIEVRKRKRNTSRTITIREMFEEKEDSFLRVIVEGKPGSGKTTLFKHCAVTWAKGKADAGQKASTEEGEHPLFEKGLVIFIDRYHEGKNLDETIRKAIKGPNKEEALKFMKNYPKSCFLFIDGLDEFISEELVCEILDLAEETTMNILVSCRLGHHCLDRKMHNFNRHVRVAGFTQEDKQHFVHNFLAALNANDTSDWLARCKRLCSILTSKKAGTIYTNPMNCAFVCLLYNEGELTDEELSTLSMKDLLKKHQAHLLKRECLKRSKTNQEAEKLEEHVQSSIQGINRMALHALIHKERKSTYSREQAREFGISLDSPAIVLLQEEFESSEQGPRKVFSWPHETVKEFQAANAAVDQNIVYLIASRPELKEVWKFLVSLLMDSSEESAKDMLLARLIMQSSDPPCSKASRLNHPCSDIPRMKSFWAQQDIDKLLQNPEEHINTATESLKLSKIHKCLRNTDWIIANIETLAELEECTSSKQGTKLLRMVIHPFLPSVLSGNGIPLEEESPDSSAFFDWLLSFDRRYLLRTLDGLFIDYRVHLVPTDGHPPYIFLCHYKRNRRVARFGRCMLNLTEASGDLTDLWSDTDSEDEHDWRIGENIVWIYLDNPEQLYSFRTDEHIGEFAAKCGEIEIVTIWVSGLREVHDFLFESISAEMKKVFRIRHGIQILSSWILANEAAQVFQSLKIRFQHSCCCLIL